MRRPSARGLRLGLSADYRYTSAYFTDTSNNPAGKLPSYGLLDAAIRLMDEDKRWEVALIGSNLTNEYYWDRSYTATFGGGGTGTTVGNPTDTYALVSRGQQVLLRFSYKY